MRARITAPVTAALLLAGCGLDDLTSPSVPADEPPPSPESAVEEVISPEEPDDAAQAPAPDSADEGVAGEAWGFPIAAPPADPDAESTGGANILPHTFPPQLPLPSPPKAEITNAYGVGAGANITLRVFKPFDEVVAFYEDILDDAGWQIVERDGRREPTTFERFELVGHGHQVNIRIEGDDSAASAFVRATRQE